MSENIKIKSVSLSVGSNWGEKYYLPRLLENDKFYTIVIHTKNIDYISFLIENFKNRKGCKSLKGYIVKHNCCNVIDLEFRSLKKEKIRKVILQLIEIKKLNNKKYLNWSVLWEFVNNKKENKVC